MHKHGIAKADLQEIKDGNKLLVKMAGAAVGKSSEMVQTAFKKEFADNAFTVESSTEIGPSIGDKLRKDTLIAAVLSMLGIIMYIAWRFDFKFGVGATLATMHDCLSMFAVFYLMNKEINLMFITAVLTIAGYSLTDTVVVFDRIRENLHKNLKGAMKTIFNDSINEVLSRTIVTSTTVFLAAISLFLFGGEVIHDFAFALLVGVIVGTYSSVFVASPIVVILEDRALAKKTQTA
jgi:preprotein translocase subunit SecF